MFHPHYAGKIWKRNTHRLFEFVFAGNIRNIERQHFQKASLAVFTLQDEQIVWTDKSSGVRPSDVNLCRTVVDLFVSTDKSSRKNRLSRWPNIRRFARRKICSSRLHIRRFVRLRRFVRPLVSKRPFSQCFPSTLKCRAGVFKFLRFE